MNCTLCGKPIVLSPSAAERAEKYGGAPADYTKLFTTHAACFVEQREADTYALMRTAKEKIMTMPPEVRKALAHVREHFPEVVQVFYGVDHRWLFCDEAFEAPNFGDQLDIGILEDAADAVPTLPAAYAWSEE